jgi:hypothetical protein
MRGIVIGAAALMLVACDGGIGAGSGNDPVVEVSSTSHSLQAQVAAHDTIVKTRPMASEFMVSKLNLQLVKNGIVGTVVRGVEARMLNPLTDGTPDLSCPYLQPRGQGTTVSCRLLVDQALADAVVQSGALTDSVEQDVTARYATGLTPDDLDFVVGWGHEAVSSGLDAAAVHAIEILRQEGACDQSPTEVESAFNLGLQQGKALLDAAEAAVLPTIPKTQCNTDVIAQTVYGEASGKAEAFIQANAVCAGYAPEDLAHVVDLAQAEGNRRSGLLEGLRQAHEALRVRLVSTWECIDCVCYARYSGAGPVYCFNRGDIAGREPSWGGEAAALAGVVPTIPQDQCSDAPIPLGSPLVVDLDGDGVRLSTARIPFDLGATGEPVLMPALDGADALLALDVDGSGGIDSGAELFGNATACGSRRCVDGIDALGRHDANHDGVIDHLDPVYRSLVLWRDANRDGASSPDELVGLEAVGIREIALRSRLDAGFVTRSGSSHRALTFTWNDGSTGLVPDVWFALEFDRTPRDPRSSGIASTLPDRSR